MKFYIIEPLANDQTYNYYGNLVNTVSSHQDSLYVSSPNEAAPMANGEDFIFLGLGFFENSFSSCENFSLLKGSPATKVLYFHKVNNDYELKVNFCKQNDIDLILTTTPLGKKIEKDTGIKTFTLEYGSDPAVFKPLEDEPKIYDVGFSGAMHENKKGVDPEAKNIRVKSKKLLENRGDLNIFWNGSDSISPRLNRKTYAHKMAQSRAWVSFTGPAWDVNGRYSEIILSKTVLLTNDIPKGYYDYFQDGVNCIRFDNDMSNFNEKLDEALSKENELTKKAYKLATEKHTLQKIYERFMSVIKL